MTPMKFVTSLGAIAAVALLTFAGMSFTSPGVHADSSNSDSRIQLGYAAVPLGLKLNMTGLNYAKVGVGSYIVNASGDCNGCHTTNPATEYSDPGNPFFNQHPTQVNLSTYLAGGNDFGPVGAGIVNGVTGPGPHIITRNLTPDYTGLPEGGHSLAEFIAIIRNGTDFDHLHPNCSATVTDNCYFSTPGNEIDGDLLQIMPWPTFHNMSDNDLEAIWEYLRAVPCNANASSPYPWVRNQCSD
jgi:hypothetical protein